MFLSLTVVLSLLGSAIGYLLFDEYINPFGSSRIDIVLVVSIEVFLSLYLFSQRFVLFNSVATAQRFQNYYWIVPGIEAGRATATFLRARVARNHRVNYLFYVGWTLAFFFVGEMQNHSSTRITPLPFGPLGFVIILSYSSEMFSGLADNLYKNLKRVNYREFWLDPRQFEVLPDLEMDQVNLDDVFQRLLTHVPREKAKEVRASVAASQATPRDVINAARAVVQYHSPDEVRTSSVSGDVILRKFGWCLAASGVVLVVTGSLAKLIVPLDRSLAVGLLFLWVPLFLSFVTLINLHVDVRAFLEQSWHSARKGSGEGN